MVVPVVKQVEEFLSFLKIELPFLHLMGMQRRLCPGTTYLSAAVPRLAVHEVGIEMIIVPTISLLDSQVQIFQGLVFGKLDISSHLGQGTMIDAKSVANKSPCLRLI